MALQSTLSSLSLGVFVLLVVFVTEHGSRRCATASTQERQSHRSAAAAAAAAEKVLPLKRLTLHQPQETADSHASAAKVHQHVLQLREHVL